MGMYPSLMGTFSFPMLVLMIGSSFGGDLSLFNSVYFHTTHMEYPCILPSPSPSIGPIEMDATLPATMVAYQENLGQFAKPSPSSLRTEEEGPYVFPTWEVESSHAHH